MKQKINKFEFGNTRIDWIRMEFSRMSLNIFFYGLACENQSAWSDMCSWISKSIRIKDKQTSQAIFGTRHFIQINEFRIIEMNSTHCELGDDWMMERKKNFTHLLLILLSIHTSNMYAVANEMLELKPNILSNREQT